LNREAHLNASLKESLTGLLDLTRFTLQIDSVPHQVKLEPTGEIKKEKGSEDELNVAEALITMSNCQN